MNWHKIIPSKKHIRYGFITLLVIVIIGLIICYFSDMAKYFFNETQKYNGEFVKFIATIFGGILVLIGLWLNYKRTITLQDQTNNQAEQIKAFVKQNEITEKGKVDERFKNAIEHLGSEKDAIVLGGIYALHRIAQEDKTYRQTVFDILCCYIRDKTSSLKLWGDIPEGERGTIKPTIVIQTIIDLLFKISDSQDYIYTGLKANLNGIRCIHANFNGAHLVDADLNNAHMEGVELRDVHLESADMYGIKWEGARLEQVHFEGSSLSYANFEGTYIDQTYFEGAKLHKANFEGSSLRDVHFEGAILPRANFKGTCLFNGYFEGADLMDAHFEGVSISNAYFEGAKLILAHFEGAQLSDTHFEGANLDKANFKGAYLIDVYFEGSNSSRLLDSEFPDNLINRIEKESELINVHTGRLDSMQAQIIVENSGVRTYWRADPFDFAERIQSAISRDTNIETDAITGILTQEKADEIIERYNKAMANVPKR